MTDDRLIHVKLECEDAVQFKRDTLSLEMGLLKIIQTIKEYHKLRAKEFELKVKLYKQIKTSLTEIRRHQKNLPGLKIPKILKEPEVKEIPTKVKHYNNDIESQLRKIQEKLDSLGTNNF